MPKLGYNLVQQALAVCLASYSGSLLLPRAPSQSLWSLSSVQIFPLMIRNREEQLQKTRAGFWFRMKTSLSPTFRQGGATSRPGGRLPYAESLWVARGTSSSQCCWHHLPCGEMLAGPSPRHPPLPCRGQAATVPCPCR